MLTAHPWYDVHMSLQKLRQRGLFFVFGIVFNRIVPGWLFRFRLNYVLQLERPSPSATESSANTIADDLTIERVTDQDAWQDVLRVTHVTLPTADSPRFAVRARVAQETVGGVWISRQQFDEPELGLRYRLADDQAWVFGAYVDRTQRNRGIYGRLLTEVMNDKTEGNQESERYFAAITVNNRSSLVAHRRFTQRSLGLCMTMRFLGIALCLTTGRIRRDRTWTFNSRKRPIELSLQA